MSSPSNRPLIPLMLAIGAAGLFLLALVDPEPGTNEVHRKDFPVQDSVSDTIRQARISTPEAQR